MFAGSSLGAIVGLWLSDLGLGAVVAFAMVMIVLYSGFAGAAVPLMLKKLNVDPALATGPFISTSNDILGLFIYLGFITLFLRFTA